MSQKKVAFSLFWRTFVLLLLLLACGVFAWVRTLREFDAVPLAVDQSSRQLASVVNLSTESLRLVDHANRPALIQALGAREGLLLQPNEASDVWVTVGADNFLRRLGASLRSRLGRDVTLAASVNGTPGVWLGFTVEDEAWWLRVPPAMLQPPATTPWAAWLAVSVLITLLGSVLIARRINRPLRDLSFAASRIRGASSTPGWTRPPSPTRSARSTWASTAWRASWPRSRKTVP